MEALSPRSPSTPTSPRRHIHSSFPHYFYSTPATPPSSDSLSAFVALCESRLIELAATAPPSNSDSSTTAEFAFGGFDGPISFDVAFADDIFREGRLLPVPVDAVPTSPLKPPPRLQYIANIRKSLRIRRLRGSKAACRKVNNNDPFAVAVEKVTREDAGPWCQLPWWWWRSRRSNVCKTDIDDAAKAKKRRGVVERVKSAVSAKDKKRKNDVLLSREESAWLIRKERSSWLKSKDGGKGWLVGLPRCTTVNTHYGSTLLACFGFK